MSIKLSLVFRRYLVSVVIWIYVQYCVSVCDRWQHFTSRDDNDFYYNVKNRKDKEDFLRLIYYFPQIYLKQVTIPCTCIVLMQTSQHRK